MSGEYIHLDVEKILQETDKAFLVRLEDGTELWLPFSQVADYEDYEAGDKNCTISITEWLARQKGIV